MPGTPAALPRAGGRSAEPTTPSCGRPTRPRAPLRRDLRAMTPHPKPVLWPSPYPARTPRPPPPPSAPPQAADHPPPSGPDALHRPVAFLRAPSAGHVSARPQARRTPARLIPGLHPMPPAQDAPPPATALLAGPASHPKGLVPFLVQGHGHSRGRVQPSPAVTRAISQKVPLTMLPGRSRGVASSAAARTS